MSFESFINNGNKLAVFGSAVYSPRNAWDLDFTLFTVDGSMPFSCSPAYSDDVVEFLKSEFGDLNPDFTGRCGETGKYPYKLSSLPSDDIRLDGYFLTGVFYPDANFLEEHYRGIYGDDFMEKLWMRYASHVQDFPFRGERLNKRHKDIAMLLKATESLSELKSVVDEYKSRYKELNEMYNMRRLNIIDYFDRTSEMVQEFIKDVKSLGLGKN